MQDSQNPFKKKPAPASSFPPPIIKSNTTPPTSPSFYPNVDATFDYKWKEEDDGLYLYLKIKLNSTPQLSRRGKVVLLFNSYHFPGKILRVPYTPDDGETLPVSADVTIWAPVEDFLKLSPKEVHLSEVTFSPDNSPENSTPQQGEPSP